MAPQWLWEHVPYFEPQKTPHISTFLWPIIYCTLTSFSSVVLLSGLVNNNDDHDYEDDDDYDSNMIMTLL